MTVPMLKEYIRKGVTVLPGIDTLVALAYVLYMTNTPVLIKLFTPIHRQSVDVGGHICK